MSKTVSPRCDGSYCPDEGCECRTNCHHSPARRPTRPPPRRNGDGSDPLNIADELKDSYLTYAMSVIISRALPDVRDGLKPSQRRILVAMNDLNLGPTSATSKCAGIVGETMKRYHPHGEATIYPTLVRMAQDWNMRYRLVHGQGNFGSIAGLPPAAMRYCVTGDTPGPHPERHAAHRGYRRGRAELRDANCSWKCSTTRRPAGRRVQVVPQRRPPDPAPADRARGSS